MKINMLSKNYCVYIHTNLINNKKYIGITCQKPIYRWGNNGNNYKHQPKFYHAIEKYGWNNFSHGVLFENLTESEAREKEASLIDKFNSVKDGYNCSIFSEEVYTKKVKCIETEEIFISVSAAAKSYNKDASTLSHHLNGDFDNAWGLHWIFINDEKTNLKAKKKLEEKKNKNLNRDLNFIKLYQEGKTIREISNLTGSARETISSALKKNGISFRSNKKEVLMLHPETKEELKKFNTLTEACNWLKISENNMGRLSSACKEEKLFKGYYWKFFN